LAIVGLVNSKRTSKEGPSRASSISLKTGISGVVTSRISARLFPALLLDIPETR
jgi:hypothetical protein